ncbi:MAG: phosphatase PAP2 family protein [Gemmatimonadaceae bacterium]|nr:phosphatase PAP2 family protein [Gemmatimonadaceae bacterium]
MPTDSTGYSWYARQPLAVRGLIAFLITAAFFAAGVLLDGPVYHAWENQRAQSQDWGRLLRIQGFLGTWAFAALALWLHEERTAIATRRARLLFASPALAGALAEVMKLILRRERPEVADGAYSFRSWSDRPFSTAGLGLPSSHTMVAFGAATMLARFYPRARWVWYALAWGCAAQRVLTHAHFLSDVMLGAVLGWAMGWGLWLRFPAPRKA